MTIEQIKASDAVFLRPVDIAAILGCDAQAIRDVAKETPERLGFPVTVMGTRTKIPRKPFLRFLGEDA
jgi:hypothetical protein